MNVDSFVVSQHLWCGVPTLNVSIHCAVNTHHERGPVGWRERRRGHTLASKGTSAMYCLLKPKRELAKLPSVLCNSEAPIMTKLWSAVPMLPSGESKQNELLFPRRLAENAQPQLAMNDNAVCLGCHRFLSRGRKRCANEDYHDSIIEVRRRQNNSKLLVMCKRLAVVQQSRTVLFYDEHRPCMHCHWPRRDAILRRNIVSRPLPEANVLIKTWSCRCHRFKMPHYRQGLPQLCLWPRGSNLGKYVSLRHVRSPCHRKSEKKVLAGQFFRTEAADLRHR